MKTFTDLQEGVYDPNIFKAFFIAGGPGSGKSFVVRKTTGGLGMKIVNSDDIFEKLLDKEGLSLKMPESEKEPRDVVRQRAKELTAKKRTNFIEGRLGLIIDGTGKDYDKIARQATKLKQIGYDVHMIFVNTSLEHTIKNHTIIFFYIIIIYHHKILSKILTELTNISLNLIPRFNRNRFWNSTSSFCISLKCNIK